MTGISWSKEECEYFRNVIMPLSEFSANGRVSGSGQKFAELATMMQRDMDARGLSRRTYEGGMMYEHYYQRVRPELQRAKAKESGEPGDSKDSKEPHKRISDSGSQKPTPQRSGTTPAQLEGEEPGSFNRSGGSPKPFPSSPPVPRCVSRQLPTKTAGKRPTHSEGPTPEHFQPVKKKGRRTIDGQPTGRFTSLSSASTNTTRQNTTSSGQNVHHRAGGPGYSSRVVKNQSLHPTQNQVRSTPPAEELSPVSKLLHAGGSLIAPRGQGEALFGLPYGNPQRASMVPYRNPFASSQRPFPGHYAEDEMNLNNSQHSGGYPCQQHRTLSASYESGGHIDGRWDPFDEPNVPILRNKTGYNAPTANLFSQAIQRSQSGRNLSVNPFHQATRNNPASLVNPFSREIQRARGTGTAPRQSSGENREMSMDRPASCECSVIEDAVQDHSEHPTSTDTTTEAATILTSISSSAVTTTQASPMATTPIEARLEELAANKKKADKEGASPNEEKSEEDESKEDKAGDDAGQEGKETTAPTAICDTCKRSF